MKRCRWSSTWISGCYKRLVHSSEEPAKRDTVDVRIAACVMDKRICRYRRPEKLEPVGQLDLPGLPLTAVPLGYGKPSPYEDDVIYADHYASDVRYSDGVRARVGAQRPSSSVPVGVRRHHGGVVFAGSPSRHGRDLRPREEVRRSAGVALDDLLPGDDLGHPVYGKLCAEKKTPHARTDAMSLLRSYFKIAA